MSIKRLSVSLTTWMCVPEFGMIDFEPLCRGSAFLVPVKSWNPTNERTKKIDKPNYHVVTCSHVLAPWRFPKLYPDEWLRDINEKHTHYTIEMRYEDGVFINSGDLYPMVFHHPTRDMAVIHIDQEKMTTDLYKDLQLETEMDLLSEKSSYFPLKTGQEISFHGHDVVAPFGENLEMYVAKDDSKDYDDEKKYDRYVVPTIIDGKIQGKSPHQIFATTPSRVLPVGMCGGPVVIRRQFEKFDWKKPEKDPSGRKNRAVSIAMSIPQEARKAAINKKIEEGRKEESVEDENKIQFGKSSFITVGMLEGIVPLDHAHPDIRGSAVFVEGPDIINFLGGVESGKVEPVIGGEALLHVSADQDPDKINMKDA